MELWNYGFFDSGLYFKRAVLRLLQRYVAAIGIQAVDVWGSMGEYWRELQSYVKLN
jgi:hypothetical protein